MNFTRIADNIRSAVIKLVSGDNAVLMVNSDKNGNDVGLALFGGSNGGKFIISAKGAIGEAHVAAVGSGYTPGAVTLTVTQSGAAAGTVSTIATAGGQLPAIDTAVTVVTGGTKYSVADTLATTGGGGTGGQVHITSIIMEEFDFIVAGIGVIFTELKDANGIDLLSLKNMGSVTLKEPLTLRSGTGAKIRNMTYSGGNVFGYNY